jgi:predicted GIY-YIG superfamily endonuclease
MPYFIYILKLVDGKYYVGLAKDLYKRLEQHFNRKGSKWTTLYQPISVEKVIESDSCFDEDKWTKIMM